MFRKVIVSRARRRGAARGGRAARCLSSDAVGLGVCSKHPPAGLDPSVRPLRPGRVVALVVGALALLFLFAGEIAAPGLIELAFAAMLLGCGLAAARPRTWSGSDTAVSWGAAAARPSSPHLDTEEQIPPARASARAPASPLPGYPRGD